MYMAYRTLGLMTKDGEKAKSIHPNGDDRKLKTYQGLLGLDHAYPPMAGNGFRRTGFDRTQYRARMGDHATRRDGDPGRALLRLPAYRAGEVG